jgi:hypothetical protein
VKGQAKLVEGHKNSNTIRYFQRIAEEIKQADKERVYLFEKSAMI